MLTLENLNWEAVATFSAGIVAVIGAGVVTFFQLRILSRQVELEELKLRSELFEKRFATYEATADLLSHVNAYIDDHTHKKIGDWLFKFRESQFLFKQETHDALSEIFQKYTEYAVTRDKLRVQYIQDQRYDARDSRKELELTTWLTNRLITVHEIFKDELRLTRA